MDTDTYQLLNHEVSGSEGALGCSDCHGSTDRMDLQGELGYQVKGDVQTVCTQCHGWEGPGDGFYWMHSKHVSDKNYDCGWCHDFTRPARNLNAPQDMKLFAEGFESGTVLGWGSMAL